MNVLEVPVVTMLPVSTPQEAMIAVVLEDMLETHLLDANLWHRKSVLTQLLVHAARISLAHLGKFILSSNYRDKNIETLEFY